MTARKIQPTGIESPYTEDELIVTKTDLKGRITYANDVFLRLSKYPTGEVIGAPHSLIRHPSMPRCIFKLLWDAIQAKKEIFAYVVNLAQNGDHYWVLAHVTPTLDAHQNLIGYHSNRRKPERAQIERVKPLYQRLAAEEDRHADRKEGLKHSHEMLMDMLKERGMEYDEFVFSI
jgi:PAS domain S-box-containing protein